MNLSKLFSISVISFALVGCGDDDEGNGGGGGGTVDPAAVANRIDNPTGQVTDADGAQGVANAFAEAQQGGTGIGGERRSGIECDIPDNAQSGSYSCTCSGGGSATVSGSATEEQINATFDYDDCCFSDCCFDGTGAYAIDNSAGATYSLCGSFDLDFDCTGQEPASVSYDYCQAPDGTVWFSVTYMSETFSVSGSYQSGVGGTWTIRDADTEWSCSEDADGNGCCTAQGEDDISWGDGCL